MKKFLLAFAFCGLLGTSAFGAKNPWVGIWKLDLAKSKFTGYTIEFAPDGNGGMLMRSSSCALTFRPDGTERATPMAKRASAWTKLGNNAFDTVTKTNGVVVAKTHREVSSDNKTLTRTAELTRGSGNVREVETFTRVGNGTGLVGTWLSTKQQRTAEETVVILPAPAGSFRTIMPDFNEAVSGKLDGSDIPVKDTKRLPGVTIAITKPSERRLEYTIKSNGKVMFKGYQTLSADGNTLTDVSWGLDRQQEKSTGVYIKQ